VYGDRLQIRVIKSIRHKGLRSLFEKGNAKGLPAAYVEKLRDILFTLNSAGRLPADANQLGFGLYPMTGSRKGTWSITVSRNWRVTFEIEKGREAVNVDFEDYH
jgi:toxin HigB-1